jgi:hypothetical protein
MSTAIYTWNSNILSRHVQLRVFAQQGRCVQLYKLNAFWLVHNIFFKHIAAIFRVATTLPVTTESLLSMLMHANYLSAVTEYLHKF